MFKLRFPVILTAAALAACASPPATTSTVTEVAAFCASANDGELTVRVEFATCVSSSCDTVTASSCTLTESGGVVSIAAEATISTEGKVCTADCGLVESTCTLTLPDGSVTVQGAGTMAEIVLPSTAEVCVGNSEV